MKTCQCLVAPLSFLDMGRIPERYFCKTMDTLSLILLESNLLDRETLAQALVQARSLGIPLQVHLVRTGLLDEGDLVTALRRSVLVGQAQPDELLSPQSQAIEAVPRTLAEAFHILPLRIDDQGHLVVAMSNPTDTHAIDELSYRTGLYVTRLVAPVGPLEAALDRWYRRSGSGTPRPSSSSSSADSTRRESNGALVLLTKVKRRPSAPPATVPVEPTDVVPLTRIKRKAAVKQETARLLPTNGSAGSLSGRETTNHEKEGHWSLPKNEAEAKAGRKKRSTLLGLPTKSTAKTGRRSRKLSGWKVPGASDGLRSVAFDALRRQIEGCHDPNDVGRALVAYLHNWYKRTLFLVVRGQSLEGRFGSGLPPGIDPRHARVSLTQPSTMAHVLSARVPFRGTIPSQGQDGVLTEILGTNGPMLLAPILIGSRAVALLCGAFPDKPIVERELGDVLVLAESQYEQILAERKKAPRQL